MSAERRAGSEATADSSAASSSATVAARRVVETGEHGGLVPQEGRVHRVCPAPFLDSSVSATIASSMRSRCDAASISRPTILATTSITTSPRRGGGLVDGALAGDLHVGGGGRDDAVVLGLGPRRGVRAELVRGLLGHRHDLTGLRARLLEDVVALVVGGLGVLAGLLGRLQRRADLLLAARTSPC